MRSRRRLDDGNISTFADYLRDFSKDTQFVVVTHRKGTMERCDGLYGVAMEEKGVSRMLSVELKDVERGRDGCDQGLVLAVKTAAKTGVFVRMKSPSGVNGRAAYRTIRFARKKDQVSETEMRSVSSASESRWLRSQEEVKHLNAVKPDEVK